MTGKDLFQEIGMIDEKYVIEAQETKRSIIHNVVFRRSLVSAACLVVCVGLYFTIRMTGGSMNETTAQAPQAFDQMATNSMSAEKEEAPMEWLQDEAQESELENSTANKSDGVASFQPEEEGFYSDVEASENAEMDSQTQNIDLIEQIARHKERLAEYPDDREAICQTEAFVISYESVLNGLARWEKFVVDTQESMATSVDVVRFTVEGDPIITCIYYDGEIYNILEDNTRDAFAGNNAEITQRTFENMIIWQEEDWVEVVWTNEEDLNREKLASMESKDYFLLTYPIEE